MTVLGGDIGAVGGFYTFRGGSNADVNITKIGGGGMVASPRPLGLGDLKWAPVLQGNIGYALIGNNFTTGYLQGKRAPLSIVSRLPEPETPTTKSLPLLQSEPGPLTNTLLLLAEAVKPM